jgi:dienelactone hydrolase
MRPIGRIRLRYSQKTAFWCWRSDSGRPAESTESPGSFGSAEDNADDVLEAVSYLHSLNVKQVFAVGDSLGGDAVGEADARSQPGSISRIVLLAPSGGDQPEKLGGRKLFIVARDDRSDAGLRLPEITNHYARPPQPKRPVILDGSAHAQFPFRTDQARNCCKRSLNSFQRPDARSG